MGNEFQMAPSARILAFTALATLTACRGFFTPYAELYADPSYVDFGEEDPYRPARPRAVVTVANTGEVEAVVTTLSLEGFDAD